MRVESMREVFDGVEMRECVRRRFDFNCDVIRACVVCQIV